jgi:hypothetical protein
MPTYVARFDDAKYLTIHRSDTVATEKSKVSFSGEEQMKPADIESIQIMDNWVIRSLMEEVFNFRDYSIHSDEGTQIREMISSTLSLFMDEPDGTFSILGFVQLKIKGPIYVLDPIAGGTEAPPARSLPLSG